ncbi:MAG: phosphatase PAP2 family protein [Eubacterium sp.]|nr:phosphatase PAP2 family protein [Eubacterium sp.]
MNQMIELLANTDIGILLYIQEHIRTPWLTPVVIFITSLGNAGIFWILLSALLLVSKKTRKAGFISFLALFASLLINNLLLKNLVARMRPFDAYQALLPLVARPVDFSFPSGHTGSSFASAYVLYKRLPKKAGLAALVLAVLIGLSRLYVGVHYPSDVLAGVFTGIASGCLAQWAYQKYFTKMER